MKFPTLTAITLATALAAMPAFAADQPSDNAAGTATVRTNNANTNAAAPPGIAPGPTAATVNANAAPAAPGTNAEIGTATVNTGNNNPNNTNVANNPNNPNNNPNAGLPHQRNPVLADNGQPRAGKVIGSDVYNMQDKKIGSVDDILMGENGQPDQAVLSVKNKLVLVPFSKLVFGNTQISGDNRVILPDETRDALSTLPEFHYNSQNKG